MNRPQPIAIVGTGGIFPQSPTLGGFWDLIARRGCAAKEVPQGRWVLSKEDAFDPRKGAADKVYSLKACFIEDFTLDPAGLELEPSFLAGLDPAFHLALHAARQAFQSAKTARLDRSRVGVVIGNIVLPTDAASALTRELLLGPLEEAALGRRPAQAGPRTHPANRFAAGLPGGVVAKALGLGGGSYTLDAACASSLYALKLAVEELRSGRSDAMLTGGVSRPESLYTQMGFSQLRALSASGRPAPFDAAADGLVVGEGAGMFLLKRLEDARRDGDKVHGVIVGIGLSNDVGGSLLAPNTVGQLRAMRQAYLEAGWSASHVDYVECHATGTPTGDPIEVNSLKALWGERGWSAGQCALGSVKSNIGHLLTAAGSAGLMKVLLGFERKILPPTANFTKEGPQIALAQSPFRVQTEADVWQRRDDKTPRRAAVSAFGFGGINAHVLIEEDGSAQPARKRSPVSASLTGVAIVGMEARFGPLSGLRAFQEAVLGAGVRAEPTIPSGRWWGAVPEGDWKGRYLDCVSVAEGAYRIPPKELEEMLPQQMLMLETAARAVADAKLSQDGRDRCGVFIGLGLDPNTTNFGLRWSLAGCVRRWAREKGWELSAQDEKRWTQALREAAGPALSANRTMGALGGIVASRIAREFQIGGPSFTVSSEESSSLRALELGVRALQRGELDSAVVGGVDIAGDLRCVLSAHEARPYSRSGRCRPFDAAAEGTVPGEGAAAVVLKRLDDALRDGDRVYAVVKGIGFACGGAGEASAPTADAYSRSLGRAYADARVDPSTVGYLEAHGSGTPEEDGAEAQALADFFGVAPAPLRCALGSVKTEIGHAGAAAGLAGLVKAALALYQEILPPFPVAQARPELAKAARRFQLPARPQYWLRNRAEGPRRAGVSALGVDGNVGHVVMEGLEDSESGVRLVERRQPLGARQEGLFAVEEETGGDLLSALSDLRRWAAAQDPRANVEALARAWYARRGASPRSKLGLAVVARDWKELLALLRAAEDSLRDNPERPVAGDRIHFSVRPAFGEDSVAFVFPGSGNQYPGMGLGLWTQWPEVLRALDAENGYLRDQMAWQAEPAAKAVEDYKAVIFGSVAHGTAVSDLVRSFGARPKAVVGYSLGETAGLFALRAWTARDEMLRRMNASSLFVSDLAGPCDAARQFWNLPKDEKVDWVLGVIDRPADTVKMALKGMERAALLIVNAPFESVVGGYRQAVDSLVEGLGCVFLPLQGVSTVHFPAAKLVEKKYRDLHLLPTQAPEGVRFYSGAWAKAYEVTRETAADSITAQAVGSFDFSALVRRAYEDGSRLFLEMGPQASCSRMISKILGPLPHAARSACQKGNDDVSTILRLLAQLIAERVPVDLGALYGRPSCAVDHQPPAPPRRMISVPLGGTAVKPVNFRPTRPPVSNPSLPPSLSPSPRPLRPPQGGRRSDALPQGEGVGAVGGGPLTEPFSPSAQAHAVFLRLSQNFAVLQAKNIAFQQAALQGRVVVPEKDVFMDRRQCLEFAVGSIGKVLGPAFAHADAYPTRVRLPDEPLMLVDRILRVEGEPNSLTRGKVVTEHDVFPGAWYLDGGRIPTCIAVEAGQADLFLSGYLGIDAKTKGLAVYRLLDAEVTFHRELPGPGETISYDINIERFVQHGDIWLFFFNFESTVAGRPLLSMKKGCAGFFTQEELDKGKGVVLTEEERRSVAGQRPADWRALAPFQGVESYSDAQLDALRRGDLGACFGPSFAALPIAKPATIPSGRMKLVDRILELESAGGRFGLGLIRGEADIQPGDWHLLCHFSDDNVMPGTLMYECCLHTLRVFLLRMGWVGQEGRVRHEPKPGVTSGLECRGQVLASTRKVVYQIEIKELGYGPEPFAVADALMFADGKPIVRITDMSLRLGGLSRGDVESLWSSRGETVVPLFNTDRITAFAVGKPSEAFGAPYKVFDEGRVIARLPGPPYQFLDRITRIEGCRPFELAAAGVIEAQYDVPADAWYFRENGQETMPFAVLLEAALQPCGWLAAYLGSALTSPIDLSFRNLGGTATQFLDVTPRSGTLSTIIKITRVSRSGGMIIQNYDMEMRCGGKLVYQGNTEFGFFTKAALSQQLGIRGASPFVPPPDAAARDLSLSLPGMPGTMLLMLDSVRLYPGSGPKGLGFLRGARKVDPNEWFFKAHFYQDPVCPGSLGLESFIQLMKLFARDRWGAQGRFESMILNEKHSWVYRGQYTPVNQEVVIEAVITSVDDRTRTLRADGFLKADGLTIYQMKDFTLALR
jgi:acyl transferase domain-containing protein/3-hydroxymyristoyl/3-hydroxydecanoyl-(acyl carrier protein) dehydratase